MNINTHVNLYKYINLGVEISNHGHDYGPEQYLSLIAYYPRTLELMDNSIPGVWLIDLAATSNCLSSIIVFTSGGAGGNFRASITSNGLTGQIESVLVTSPGGGYSSDPHFVLSSASCTCKGLPGNVAGNFDACLMPRRAHGASFGGIVARNAVVYGSLPRVFLSGMTGVQNVDSVLIPVQRHGFEYSDGSLLFGAYGQWIKASQTFVLRMTGMVHVYVILLGKVCRSPCVRLLHDSLIRSQFIHKRDIPHSYVTQDSMRFAMRQLYVWRATHSHLCHDSSVT